MRTIIVGDIHGCSRALTALLQHIDPDPDRDRIVFLGDLFDRGPDSWQVFGQIRALAEDFHDRFVLLRGNHEDYLLQPRLTFFQKRLWMRVGRQASVDSFRRHHGRLEDSAPWLRDHCRLYWKDEDIQCVHAGILVDPLEANDVYTLVHDHETVLQNRYAGPLTVTGHIALKAA